MYSVSSLSFCPDICESFFPFHFSENVNLVILTWSLQLPQLSLVLESSVLKPKMVEHMNYKELSKILIIVSTFSSYLCWYNVTIEYLRVAMLLKSILKWCILSCLLANSVNHVAFLNTAACGRIAGGECFSGFIN